MMNTNTAAGGAKIISGPVFIFLSLKTDANQMFLAQCD